MKYINYKFSNFCLLKIDLTAPFGICFVGRKCLVPTCNFLQR